jgi:hypothetical protein
MGRAEELFDRLSVGGSQEIDALIRNGVTEELFLDYKRSADAGAGATLHNADRSSLARAISGFGNSEGGVVVWGVDCRNVPGQGDIPNASHPISHPNRFKSWLEQATSGLTVPSHSRVQHAAVGIAGTDTGYVLSLIPSGLHAPYQTIGDMRYLMRAGSNFAPVPHAILAGMFGRRPQPSINYSFIINRPHIDPQRVVVSQLGVLIGNFGVGIATDVFANFMFKQDAGPNCSVVILPARPEDPWTGQFSFGRYLTLVTKPDVRLPPEAYVLAVNIVLKLAPPFEAALEFESLCGATGSPSARMNFVRESAVLEAAYRQLTNANNDAERTAAEDFFNDTVYRNIGRVQ